MTYNVQELTIIILIPLFLGAGITYALTNKTIEQQIEEQNTAILQDCLSKARVKEVPSEILESASHCNKDLLKTIYSPLYSRTGATMNATGSKVPEPLGFQLIPQASAKSVTNELDMEKSTTPTKEIIIAKYAEKIRSPKQIYEQVKHLGYRESPTISLIQSCKSSSSDIQKCILFGLIIMYNESGNNQNSFACINRNNCLGVKSGTKKYSNIDEGMENWIQIFNRYWYKAEKPSFFYSEKGKISKSRYCVSESSSNTEIGCPNGLKIANKKYEQLYPIIYLK